MIRILGTFFVALMGLAFGSFLNVCATRWPLEENIVSPRSRCRSCHRPLAWWENVPLVSWLALRGRCRNCHSPIGWRYPLVEFAVAALWAVPAWKLFSDVPDLDLPSIQLYDSIFVALAWMLFYWLMVALFVLDLENLWLPDWLTLPGTVVGCLVAPSHAAMVALSPMKDAKVTVSYAFTSFLLSNLLSIAVAGGFILLIRAVYWLFRRREGIGLGDAKLMALLGAWLGLPGAILAFVLGVFLGASIALIQLAIPAARKNSENWAMAQLPLGSFLCVGAVVSALWGQPMIAAWLRWSSF
jgi:leader peptidase (prepilin peptidase) / N-methyltransferase